MSINDIRKTLAYKICGYIFYLCLVGIIIYGSIWVPKFFIFFIVASGVVIIPRVLLPILIILTIMGYYTREKFKNSSFNIIADVGNVSILLLSLIIICIYIIQDVLYR